MSVVTTVVAAGAKKAAEEAAESVVRLTLEPFIAWLRSRLNARSDRESLLAAISNDFQSYTKLKPLGTFGHAIYVEDLFAPIEVKMNGKTVSCLDESLSVPRALLFEGLGGQGKTLLLRYLYAVCAKPADAERNSIPLILPVDLIVKARGIRPALELHLKDKYKVAAPVELLQYLKESGLNVILFVDDLHKLEFNGDDWFDLDEDIKSSLEVVARIIAVGRPGGDAAQANAFTNVRIGALNHTSLKPFFERLHSSLHPDEKDYPADAILGGLSEELRDKHLTNPFVATLLYIQYREKRQLPKTIVDLYDKWYQVIARDCHLLVENKTNVERLAWHWFSDKRGRVFDESWVRETLGEAPVTFNVLRRAGLLLTPSSVPFELSFCHDRIAEYLAACWVHNSTDEIARKCYERMADDWLPWSGVLGFLFEMDKPRMLKWFLRADLEDLAKSVFGRRDFSRDKMVNSADVKRFSRLCTVSRSAEEIEARDEDVTVFQWKAMGWWARRYRWYEHAGFYDELRECLVSRDPSSSATTEQTPTKIVRVEFSTGNCNVDEDSLKAILQVMFRRARDNWKATRIRRRSTVDTVVA